MTLEDNRILASRVILAGFEGTSLPAELARDIEAGAVGGIVLFKRNVASVEQVASLLAEIRSRAPEGQAPLTALDQEGGRVIRIREPLTVLPPARAIGALNDPTVAFSAGRLVGLELRALGFTVNFAPVLDVDTNPDSPVIGDRSYSPEVTGVIQNALAFGRGHRDSGIFPVAKHFPGHGDATVDSHLGLPTVTHGVDRLAAVEMEPFAAWARTGLGPIMTAHIVFPALDPENPATASSEILTHLLRERYHFNGAILTDDLEMGALNAFGGAETLAARILRAGADGLLICRDLELRERVLSTLATEATTHSGFAARLVKAITRLSPLAYPSGPFVDMSFIGSETHENMKHQLHARLMKKEP